MKSYLFLFSCVFLVHISVFGQGTSTYQNGIPISINQWKSGLISASMFQESDTFSIVMSEKLVSFAFQLVIKYSNKEDSVLDVRCNKDELIKYKTQLQTLKSGDTVIIDKAKGIDLQGKNVVIKTTTYYLTD